MNRTGSKQPSQGATLGDALSQQMKDELGLLRRTLKQRAEEVAVRQLKEPVPPWRRQRKRANASKAPKATTESGFALGVQVTRTHVQPDPPKGRKRGMRRSRRTDSESTASTFQYWDLPSGATSLEPPPDAISREDGSHFNRVLHEGFRHSNAEGEDLFVVLGVDFGTSCTKVVVRLPYEPGEPTMAIPAPHPCRIGDEPYLWQTVLWLSSDGTYTPWPESGAEVLKSLKQELVQGQSKADGADVKTAAATGSMVASAVYLAYVVRYVKGRLLSDWPELFHQRRPVWSLNVGMPAESYDDVVLAKQYRRIGSAALLLSKIEASIDSDTVRAFLGDERVLAAQATDEAAEDLGVVVVPEAAAEMTAFAKSARRAPGLYLMVDIGAMTLDASMFRLNHPARAGEAYAFMAAQVRPLGVDSVRCFLEEGKTEAECAEQCSRTLRSVVWHTKRRRDPRARNWTSGNDVPVFLAGGGATNRLHRNVVDSLGPWLKQYARNEGIRILDLPVPGNVQLIEPLESFERMAVAWGLSYPRDQMGKIESMRDIDDIPPPAKIDRENPFISKDHV